MPGDGDCGKPGRKGSKHGMKSLKDSQSSIKEQLQQMIDQMKMMTIYFYQPLNFFFCFSNSVLIF